MEDNIFQLLCWFRSPSQELKHQKVIVFGLLSSVGFYLFHFKIKISRLYIKVPSNSKEQLILVNSLIANLFW